MTVRVDLKPYLPHPGQYGNAIAGWEHCQVGG